MAIYDAICSKWKTKIWSPSQNIHIVFLGWVQYLKVQWGLGGVGTAHVLRRFCFRHQGMFCAPAKCRSSPCSQDSFAPASAVFHANLGRKPYIDLLPEICLNYSQWIFRLRTPHSFFNFFGSSISVFFGLGGFDGNDEEWQEQYQVLGLNSFICGDSGMVGWFQLTNWRLLIH